MPLPLLAGLAWAGVGLLGLPPADLELPQGPAPEIAEAIPVSGPWRLVGVVDGVRSFEAPLPVRPRSLFFSAAPAGMELRQGARKLAYSNDITKRGQPGTWEFTPDSVVVRIAADQPRPGTSTFTLTWPSALEREARLHPDADADIEWVTRSTQLDDTSRDGLYLPAPARIAWNVDLPEGANLRFNAGILPPEVADGTVSDGAWLDVTLDGEVVRSVRLAPRRFEDVTVPLGGAARTAKIGLVTRDDDPVRDHVLVGAPTIYVPTDRPRRVVLVFIDTLRRDHLGVYGHTRGASPHIDAFASEAVVFDNARSVAPWTLPSTRAALSGLAPERWPGQDVNPRSQAVLPRVLAANGWATAAYVGNVYLSSNFEMAGGWGEHRCVNWPSAAYEVHRTEEFFARHRDQDAAVMVHFMDMHLPYKEPLAYRRLYTDGDLPGLGSMFTRAALLKYVKKADRDEVRDYLLGRYDQNLKFIDDQLGRLFRTLGDDATVVLFADHGEEFWDHGDLEHGHTFYDELLRVPFIVKSPGLAPRRVDAPASLLDLTPTVLDLLGFPVEGFEGWSLAGLARGEPDPRFDDRPIAFGRPLYGETGWGSVRRGLKYVSREGEERTYDLSADPGEQDAEAARAASPLPGRAALADALGVEVSLGFRITPQSRSPTVPVEVRVPGGIAHAWVGDDPTEKSTATLTRVDDETVRIAWGGTGSNQREVFLLPAEPAEAVVETTTLRVARDGEAPVALVRKPLGKTPLGRVTATGRATVATWAVVPLPFGTAVDAFDEEMAAALQAIGYMEDDR